MKRQRNVNLLLMLVLLVAVGQMAQTIYIPAIADMARDLNVREGAVQSVMGAYLLTYGVSQLFYCRQRDAGDGHRRWRRNGAYFTARFI